MCGEFQFDRAPSSSQNTHDVLNPCLDETISDWWNMMWCSSRQGMNMNDIMWGLTVNRLLDIHRSWQRAEYSHGHVKVLKIKRSWLLNIHRSCLSTEYSHITSKDWISTDQVLELNIHRSCAPHYLMIILHIHSKYPLNIDDYFRHIPSDTVLPIATFRHDCKTVMQYGNLMKSS